MTTKTLTIFLLFILAATSLFAAIPVDVYQGMESGANGDLLTTALMNTSSHGKAMWSVGRGELWVSTSKVRDLPGPVVVGGTTFASKTANGSLSKIRPGLKWLVKSHADLIVPVR